MSDVTAAAAAAAAAIDAAPGANPSGYYHEPRRCKTCGRTFSGRNDYWKHRLAHEAYTDALVARSSSDALDALMRAIDR